MSEIRMWCADCGRERTVPSASADPGPCVCGCAIRVSFQPRSAGAVVSIPLTFTETNFGTAA